MYLSTVHDPTLELWRHQYGPLSAVIDERASDQVAGLAIDLRRPGEDVLLALYPISLVKWSLAGIEGQITLADEHFDRRGVLGGVQKRDWLIVTAYERQSLSKAIRYAWNISGNETFLVLIGKRECAAPYSKVYRDDLEWNSANAESALRFFPTVMNRGHDGERLEILSKRTNTAEIRASLAGNGVATEPEAG